MYCGTLKESVLFLPSRYDIVDNEVYLDCKNNLQAFIESGDYGYIDNILSEGYHVGSYGYDPETGKGNAIDYHNKRLELKRSGNLAGRKDAFWRDLILGTTSRVELDDMMGPFGNGENMVANFNQRMSQKHGYKPNDNLDPKHNDSAITDLLSSIHKDLGSDFKSLSRIRRVNYNSDSLKDLLKQPGVANKLSASTKSKILKFDKEYRAASREAMNNQTDQAKNISKVVKQEIGKGSEEISDILSKSNEKMDQSKKDAEENLESIRNLKQEVEQAAENKPKSWIGKKIAALRKLYSEWLQKKNQEHDQKKIGFFSNILRLIAKCIDFLLKKLQNFAG